MALFKFSKAIFKSKAIQLYNKGNHTRDFTYIGDVVRIMQKLMYLKNKKNHEIFNICSNRPIKLFKVVNFLNSLTSTPKIKKVGFQKADVLKTHGSNKKIKKLLNFKKFTDIDKGLFNTFVWYKNYLENKL